MPGYDYEVTGGLDTYIYVIDNGINMQNRVSDCLLRGRTEQCTLTGIEDFARMPFHPIEWFFAPSVSKLTSDESVRGHGSCTASKALVSFTFAWHCPLFRASLYIFQLIEWTSLLQVKCTDFNSIQGWITGVSKNSHLVVMKSSLNIADIHYAFSTALDDIITKGRVRKSVILFPHASVDQYNRFTRVPKNWDAIRGLIREAFAHDIPVVVPAGNYGVASAPRAVNTVPAIWGVSPVPGVSCLFIF